ncbi:MAG: glycosyltransferase family 2 protein [Candidatus Omnitrophica bacterium]|nr:glycosyltransferase family 2 protein [Candidatus Omnitrophota bacterium]
MRLSVVIPVYNERGTISQIIGRVEKVPLTKEIILVDDGSSDGTDQYIREHYSDREGFKLAFHGKNRGKGAAVRTGIALASADAVVIQDADLEYDPIDHLRLVRALELGGVRVVYGSRFLKKEKVTSFWHRAVNYFLTQLTNVLYGAKLTDMETCYKVVRRDLLREIDLISDGFEIEAELTAKLLKRGEAILEVPVSYKGRSYREGKKIGWKDGLKTVAALLRYWGSS